MGKLNLDEEWQNVRNEETHDSNREEIRPGVELFVWS
jgi:hypothetical protein